MTRLAVLAVLALSFAGPLHGQGLPAPQFATPAANDSSSRAATTAWVRSLNLLTANSDLSLATVKPAGASVARTQAARAADVFNVLDYGAVADGTTDIGPALNAIAARLGASATSNVVYFPNGVYRLASAVTFAGTAPILLGQGFSQGPGAVGTGTWIKIDQTGFTPITFSGTNARGAKVRDLAFYQVHPAPAAGWAPTAYDYVFRVQDALGEVTFDNVLFAGVNRGIYADNSGRLNIRDVQGQFYTTGIEIDDCYDIPRIQRLHAWTFATSSPSVVAYQEAHADAVLLRRADGIFIGDLFALGMYSAIHMSSGANGVTTKAYVVNLYADFVNYGLLIDGPGSDVQVANLTSQNNDQTNSGSTLPNGNAVWVNATNVTVQIGNLYSKLTAGPAIEVDGSGNRVNVANLRANTFGTPGAGTPAILVADSGSNAGNQVYVANKEQLQGVAPLVLFNTGTNGGRERFVMMNDAGGANPNEARAYSAGPGGAPQLAAIGGDANVDLYLNGKGTSGVRLQSSGQTVLRADNLNGSTNDFLLRGGAGTMNWIAEGGDPNIDVFLIAKGSTGGVRLVGNGSTVLRVDNANAVADDMLLRASAGAINLIAEGADSNVDLVLSPKGARGGVRLQANAATVMRLDNLNAGTSDLLLRSGPAVIALTVEDPAANANLVLNPKGTGLVSTGVCPGSNDNSSNLACTSWVKGLGYAPASALGPLATQPAVASAPVAATGPTGLLVAAAVQGNGAKVQLASGAAVAGDCVKFDANGNAVDAGSPCGTGSGAGGITALIGDVTASGSGSVAATLASVGTPGSYARVTTDAKGRVVSGAPLAASDVTAALGFAPLPTASPSPTGTLTVGGTNSVAVTSAASGSAPGVAALGGDASVDLALSAAGPSGSARLIANGGTVFRADNPNGGNTDVLVRSGFGVVSLTVESAAATANLALLPKATGVVTAPTAAASDNSTTLATTAFVKSLAYAPAASPALTGTATIGNTNSLVLSGAASGGAPSIAATGGDAAVDLALTGTGAGSVRLKANGVTVLRADSPSAGSTDVLVRSGPGTVSFTAEDGGANASIALNPKGSGTVAVPTPASSSNTTTAASTGFVRAVLPCVQPQAGRAYAPPFATLSTAALTNTTGAQSISAMPLIVCGSRAVSALAFEITTATSSAFSARLALYADSGGLPGGAPLADSGVMAIAASATGVQIATISGPTLAPGIYWLTLQSSYVAAPATVKAISTGGPGGVGQALGYSLAQGAASAIPTGVSQAGTFGPPPNPFGSPTGYVTSNAPMVWVQF